MITSKPFIQFTEKGEDDDAYFICPKSFLDSFVKFLHTQKIEVLFSGNEWGKSNDEPLYAVEVSNVNDAQSEVLISKYIASLRNSS